MNEMHLHWTEATNSFCRNDHYKNILRCDMIWHNLSAHNTACTKYTYYVTKLPYQKCITYYLASHFKRNRVYHAKWQWNEMQWRKISLQIIIKMQRFVDFYYSNATLDEFGISFQMLPALPLGKLTHSNVD